jgi:hypothetical protein
MQDIYLQNPFLLLLTFIQSALARKGAPLLLVDEKVKLDAEPANAVAPTSAHEWLPQQTSIVTAQEQFVMQVDKDQEKRKVE